MDAARLYPDAYIAICNDTAQADLSKINKKEEPIKEPLEFVHAFDSRWSPGHITDKELEAYFDICSNDFVIIAEKISKEI